MSFPLTSSSLSIPSSSSSSSSSGSQILSYPHSPSIPVSQLFTRKELVGKGAYGGVYKGIHNPTGQVVALKVIDLDTPEDDISEIQKEVAVLSEFRNEDAIRYNVTAYHGCYLNGYELWIAMDFASGGSIRTLMKCGPIEEKYAALIVREVLVALSFLHRQDIIHRDVKAANILLTQTGKILLCDFGVAAHLQMSNSGKRSTFTGTPLWMAPEVITDGKLYDTKADIWSLGITLYEIIVGNPPHFGIEPLRACAIIPTSQPPSLPEQFSNQTSSQMREFLSSCLMVDPTDRPSAEELSKTKWIKSASKLPMVLLRELIVRYVSWIQSGGQRTSIVGTLPGSSGGLGGSEEDLVQREDTFELTGQREEGWDFDLDEQDFNAVQLGLGPSAGGEGLLGDEPNYRGRGGGGGGMMMSLDELAAKSNLRPPKQSQPQPASSSSNRNHPLLRLFDEESNPYAQPNPQTSSSSSSNPLISLLPSSSLNTLKPTISLPSFDTIENSSSDQIDLGISLPSFGDNNDSSGFGFGSNSSSGYGGAGWGGAGWNTQTQYNDAFNSSGTGSSPFDTIGPSENFGSGITTIQGEEEQEGEVEEFDVEFGGGGGGGGTVRGSSSRRGGISEDYTTGGGRGGGGGVQQVQDSSNNSKSGDQFERKEVEEEDIDTWGKGKKEMTQGGGDRDRDENGIPGFGGLGNGFKFGGTRTITIDTSPLAVAEEEEEVSTPTLAKTNFANKDSTTIPTPPLRKRADTAPSFHTTTQVQINATAGGGGGYPPLGPGLPRNENGKVGGYPPLGVGLSRSANLSIVETREEEEEEEQEQGIGINRPFGGGSNLNRNFQFGGNRGRAATMLNNNNSNSSERPILKFEAGSGGGGDRKRSESDSNKRQGLTITTGGISGASSSTTGGRSLNSPSPASASSPSISSSIPHGQPPKHKRQASSLSTHSYTAPSPDSSESSHHHHRSNQLSTSSSSTSSNSTILLTTSPTSSLSISSQQQKSITLSGRGEGEGDGEYKDQQQQLATPLAAQPQQSRNEGNGNGDNRDVVDEKEVLMMNNTAIGFPFPPVGDLLVPTTSSSSNQLPSVSQEEEGEEEYIYEEEEVEEIIPLSIKPLDYSILKDRSTVEKELELVLEGLGDWFKIVREGLEKVLEDSGGTEGGGGVEQQQEGRREFIVGLDLRGTIEGIQVK